MGEVAERLGCSKSTVHKYINEHNIKSRPHPSELPLSLRTNMEGYERWQTNSNGEHQTVKHHRLLAVAKYGFDAVRNKDVHHKNHLRWDNRPENIELLGHEEHSEHHASTQERGETGEFI